MQYRSHQMLLRLVLFLLMGLLPVCVLAMSQKDEIAAGRKAMTELRAKGISREAALTKVGAALRSQVARKDLPWQFWVQEDTKQLNAFALPGGFVFITRAYYERLNADELAFVIGHEMAHIDLKHFEKVIKRARTAQVANILAAIIVSSSHADRGWSTAADVGATAYYTKYSRKAEREADLGGYTFARKAGFDANGAVTALQKLGKDKSDPITANIFATHPILSSREDRLAAMKNDNLPAQPRPNITKVAKSDWKPVSFSKDELRKRPGLAIRIVGEDGERWDRKWHDNFREILTRAINTSTQCGVRGDERADGRKAPDYKELAEKDKVKWLLVVTVHQMSSDADKNDPNSVDGNSVTAVVHLGCQIIDVENEEPAYSGQVDQTLAGTDFFPLDGAHLMPDMTLTQAVTKTANAISKQVNTLK
jgi:Zn-dependent protease with chaperone function